MSGSEVLHHLRQIDAAVPVVLISGYSDIDMQERMRSVEISGFVKKPFRGEALVASIRSAVRPARPSS
jgi:FixJ family two-component response regulator